MCPRIFLSWHLKIFLYFRRTSHLYQKSDCWIGNDLCVLIYILPSLYLGLIDAELVDSKIRNSHIVTLSFYAGVLLFSFFSNYISETESLTVWWKKITSFLKKWKLSGNLKSRHGIRPQVLFFVFLLCKAFTILPYPCRIFFKPAGWLIIESCSLK